MQLLAARDLSEGRPRLLGLPAIREFVTGRELGLQLRSVLNARRRGCRRGSGSGGRWG